MARPAGLEPCDPRLTSSVLYPSELSARRNSGDMRAHVFRQDPMNERLVPDVATPGFPPEALQQVMSKPSTTARSSKPSVAMPSAVLKLITISTPSSANA